MLEFKLPEIGEGVVEGEIVRWHKQPGEFVQANEALVEVMTDKATIEVPSPVAGTLREIVAQVGDICAVEQVIAILDLGVAATVSMPVTATVAPASGASVLATPAARALARESGIDLRSLPVDERGRITKDDVMRAQQVAGAAAELSVGTGAKSQVAAVRPAPVVAAVVVVPEPKPAVPTTAAAPLARPAPVPTKPAAPLARPAPTKPSYAVTPEQGDEEIPFRGMRRRIAESMVRSYTTAVHYTYVEQVNVTRLVKLRAEAKAVAAEQGVSLTFLPFIVKAAVHALKKYPIVNAELDEAGGRIIVKKRYNIGVAATTDQGLMVPVVHGADRMSILDLGREIARLGEAARAGTCTREELTGSTFSISSLGNIGGVLATPIINYPEVGIIGVHAIRKVPIVDERDNIVIGHLMNLSVSLDHRVVDGFQGASFLQEVRRYLEDPNLLLLAGI
ncbi:dihydrolipoamide acetyltransferase family protein [Nannocystis sp.]|uniref:dihydrolipoamide acetyltransferase family protein n=1 Tax=Nannocystis sp. TaxID=1962667 RepID=UPI0024286C84|nr:dihydrolipoamide acetyltransferase family protein [Nannocystis sp.]MBK7824625.1 2-oxo acid dehydrogenase subunit E2 [Nannocystis sp.]MBK9753124.1 2-oxo acid dehydrogenase subunit E2 [Nannocystis sp.]